jgi:acetate---CoA ligase (ADP-forming) subunit beta
MTNAAKAWLSGLAHAGKPDEFESKQLLALHGLRVPGAFRIHAAELAAVEHELPQPGFDPPWVLKVCSPDILHKTEKAGVQLDVDRKALPAAVREMRERFPSCDLLVEEQVRFSGTEFIIGAFRDPSFGPAVMAGAGGILTELYQDVAFRLVPCAAPEAMRMLKELKVFPALEGFRGIRMDAAGLADAISQVSGIVESLGEGFGQLDINPMVFCAAGWTALDAKVILATGGAAIL